MSFDYQPTLSGKLITLRPLQPDDFEALYAVASDPLIWQQHPKSDRCHRDVFTQFFDDAITSGGALLVLDNATGAVIGSSRFHDHDEEQSEVELGWTFLARSHWGGQYNGEMKRLMLEHAFQFVRHVILLIAPENQRSRRAAEKIGAIQSGTRPINDGSEHLVYRISRGARDRSG
ncbi:MAG: GNAT family N-acetyltransferase [Phycisphaerales bacterium]